MKDSLKVAILSTFLFSLLLPAQQNKKLDSLLTIYNNLQDAIPKYNTLTALYELTLYNDPEAAKKYVDRSAKLAKKIQYKKGIAQANYNIGVYFNSIGLKDSAYANYQIALDQHIANKDISGQTAVTHGLAILKFAEAEYDGAIKLIDQNIEVQSAQQPVDSIRLASSYYLKGYTHVQKGNLGIALTETLKSLKIFERLNEPVRKADAITLLSEIEYELGNIDKSLEYDKQSLVIYEQENDLFYQAETLLTIADTYIEKKEYDVALQYLEESLLVSQKIQSPSIASMILGAFGTIHIEREDYLKGLDYTQRSWKISKTANRPGITAENWLSFSKINEKTNHPKKAARYLDSVIEYATKTESKDLLKRAYFEEAKLSERQQDFKKAYTSHTIFHRISDSILNAKKSRQIEELRTIYDTEKKEQQIALQEKEITVLEQQKKISAQQKFLLGGSLLLSLLGFYGLRQKMKRNKIEKEKVDAELAFKKKELTTHALNLARKNETLENLKTKAQELKEKENAGAGYNQLIRTINFDLQDDNNWENFSRYFEEVHKDFNSNVKTKYPQVTSNELRLLALLKMNLSSKEIANILNISPEGIKKARYRLRKKLDIRTEDSLQDLVLRL